MSATVCGGTPFVGCAKPTAPSPGSRHRTIALACLVLGSALVVRRERWGFSVVLRYGGTPPNALTWVFVRSKPRRLSRDPRPPTDLRQSERGSRQSCTVPPAYGVFSQGQGLVLDHARLHDQGGAEALDAGQGGCVALSRPTLVAQRVRVGFETVRLALATAMAVSFIRFSQPVPSRLLAAKAIADASHRLEGGGLPPQLPPQRPHHDVDDVAAAAVAVSPHFFDER
jgi:hypothetical protein